jgi:8-oxo-dGTP pyrophosphatase MutT (NUDIX family)
MTRNLTAHNRLAVGLEGAKHAAVALVVVDSDADRDGIDPVDPATIDMSMVPEVAADLDGTVNGVSGGAAFLLCRRASRMNTHAGQWALPGGRLDAGETAIDAALRELDEEVGLRLSSDHVLGVLDDYRTRSGYVITPVVIWGGGDVALTPNPSEVAHVYRIGLHELCRTDSPRFVTIPESDRPVVQVPIGRDLIHAPTAAAMVQFRWVAIEGRVEDASRVAHFEQPVFAWK